MLWMIFTTISTFFYGIGNYIQNFLADVALPRRRAGAYVLTRIFSFSLALILLISIFGRAVFMLPITNALGIMLAGAINIIGAVYYYKALQAGDTFDVTIFSYAGPIISLGLGAVILNESITPNQGLGFIFIMVAALIIVLAGGTKQERRSPNISVATITAIHAFFSVFSDIIYAYFIQGISPNFTLFAQSFFFFELGSLLAVIWSLIFFQSWRKAIARTFFTGRKHRQYFVAAFIDNLNFLIGEIFYKLALLVAPIVALVAVISKIANLFLSFFLTAVVGRAFPKFIHSRRLTKQLLFRYASSGLLVAVGIMLMR